MVAIISLRIKPISHETWTQTWDEHIPYDISWVDLIISYWENKEDVRYMHIAGKTQFSVCVYMQAQTDTCKHAHKLAHTDLHITSLWTSYSRRYNFACKHTHTHTYHYSLKDHIDSSWNTNSSLSFHSLVPNIQYDIQSSQLGSMPTGYQQDATYVSMQLEWLASKILLSRPINPHLAESWLGYEILGSRTRTETAPSSNWVAT
jgi:hypothetical protein